MEKPAEEPVHPLNIAELTEKIQSGYTVNRISKQTQKKTFAPSTIAYGHGECPRYWYLAFDGQMFEDNADAYGAANMTAGSLSHGRIQKAMKDAGILIEDEFKITYVDPPIFESDSLVADGVIIGIPAVKYIGNATLPAPEYAGPTTAITQGSFMSD